MMDPLKYKKFFKEENYVHCTICGNYSNINSFAHRKSVDHQKKLSGKLRKITIYLSQKMKQPVIHDADWPEKDLKRFCHFCGDQYPEHNVEEEFVTEHFGSLYHHASTHHIESVKSFLKRNFRKEKVEKFCVQNKDLEGYLEKVHDAKKIYLKKMDFINEMVLKQIRDSEEERKMFFGNEIQMPSSSSKDFGNYICESKSTEIKTQTTMLSSVKNKEIIKVPPWLEDIPSQSSEHQSTAPVIGPTIDTLVKHVRNQKKKGLSKSRVGANFRHHAQSSSKWLPSYQGVWNQGRRKQLKIQFNRRNRN